MGGFGIPKFFVKFWDPLFLALKFTFLFLNVAKIQILFLKVPMGGGSAGLGIIPKKKQFFLLLPLAGSFFCRHLKIYEEDKIENCPFLGGNQKRFKIVKSATSLFKFLNFVHNHSDFQFCKLCLCTTLTYNF